MDNRKIFGDAISNVALLERDEPKADPIPASQIFEGRTFTNDLGQTIQSRTPVDDYGIVAGNPTFFSTGQIIFRVNNQGPPQQYNYLFGIDGATVGEAFANFIAAFTDAEAKAKIDLQRQIQAATAPKIETVQEADLKKRFGSSPILKG